MTKLGLFDTQDACWIGDESGPHTYDDAQLAKIARDVVTVMFDWGERLEVRPYAEADKRRDELTANISGKEALAWLEDNYPMRRRVRKPL